MFSSSLISGQATKSNLDRSIAFLFLLFSPFFLINPVHAQSQFQTINLEKNQVFKWEYNKSKKIDLDGKTISSGQSKTIIFMHIIEKTSLGYTLDIKFNNPLFDDETSKKVFSNKTSANSTKLKKMIEQIGVLTIRIRISKDGDIQEIVNFAELKMFTSNLLNTMSRLDGSTLDRAGTKKIEDMFMSDIGIRNIFLKDVPLLFYGVNVDLTGKNKFEYETELMTMFSEKPLIAKGTIFITKLDKRNNVAELTVDQRVDSKSFLEILKIDKLERADIFDRIQIKVDLKSGLSTQAISKRISIFPNLNGEDTSEFLFIKN